MSSKEGPIKGLHGNTRLTFKPLKRSKFCPSQQLPVNDSQPRKYGKKDRARLLSNIRHEVKIQLMGPRRIAATPSQSAIFIIEARLYYP